VRRLVLLLLLVTPASAQAAGSQLYAADGFLHRPALAGDRVVAAEQRPGRVIRLLSAPVAGSAPPTTLLEAAPGRGGPAFVTYAGSPSRVLARRSFEGASTDIIAGPPLGPLTTLDACAPAPEFAPPPAVDGDLAAWAGADCLPAKIRIQAGDATRTIDAGGFVHAVAVARPYVAWLAMDRSANPIGARLVVHDVTTGQDAYTANVPPATELDVQSDGTAVIATFAPVDRACSGGPRAQFVWYSPANPQGTEIPVGRACEAAVRIAGGRIAFVAAPAGARRVLSLATLAGGAAQPVARVDSFPPLAAFDFDGTRVAWSQVRCRDHVLRVRDAADTSPPDPAVACPLRIGTPRLRRDRRIHVPVACPNGCRSLPRLGMTVIAPRWLHVWRRTRRATHYAPYAGFDIRPGGRAVVKLRTTRYQRRVIRRKGRVPVRLKVNAQNVYLARVARTLRSR